VNIKLLREKLGLSQQDLCDRTGIPKGRINNWEQGKGKPKAKDNKILTDFFKLYEIELSQNISTFDDPESKYLGETPIPEVMYLREINKLLREKIQDKLEAIEILKESNSFLKSEIERLHGERTNKSSIKKGN
jgi:transcriptional regulator with XRE-family HTH domain